MKRKSLQWTLVAVLMCLTAAYASAHCEIPCGIYDDQMRIDMMSENIETIEKAMTQILALAGEQPVNYNQLTRWVTNKDHHASELQHIVSQYFMTQRIKPDTEKYTEKLTLLHKMLISAMKCKQTTDLSNVTTLRALLKDFGDLYLGHKK